MSDPQGDTLHEMYTEPPPVPDFEIGMAAAFFPHANGTHDGWSGRPYRATVTGGSEGMVELECEDHDPVRVQWGHPNVWARRNDAAFAIPWEDRLASATYDD